MVTVQYAERAACSMQIPVHLQHYLFTKSLEASLMQSKLVPYLIISNDH